MEHKPIHQEGPTFSRIISGAWRWNLEESKIEQLIQASLDSNITTFDHADIYGDHSNEEIFGNVLKKNSGLRNTGPSKPCCTPKTAHPLPRDFTRWRATGSINSTFIPKPKPNRPKRVFARKVSRSRRLRKNRSAATPTHPSSRLLFSWKAHANWVTPPRRPCAWRNNYTKPVSSPICVPTARRSPTTL